MTRTKFKVGDRVYAPFHGYGTVIRIYDHPSVMPVVVKWENDDASRPKEINSFTEDGYLSYWTKDDDTRISLAREPLLIDELGKYKVGDKVYAPYRYGTITAIYGDGRAHPIEVTWEPTTNNEPTTTAYAVDGYMLEGVYLGFPTLTVIRRTLSTGDEIMDTKGRGFKVGDRVWSQNHGVGVVVSIDADAAFPIKVRWPGGDTDIFTIDGRDALNGTDQDYTIYLLTHHEDETMKDNTKEYTAIDPAHYRVKGIPEAIEIMEHLMTKEQLEGFLWGNILKYAYRYGRKGDKAETAGKIGWYANKLKEVCAEKKEQE